MHFIGYKVNFRNSIRKYLFFLNVFSIDIAIAGVSGFISVNKVFGLPQNPVLNVLLFIGILLIYWLDHLQDIRKYGSRLSRRHYFLSKIKTRLIKTGLLLFALSAAIAFYYLSLKVLLMGFFLLFVSLIYLALHPYRFVPKEIFAASVYTAGIYFEVLFNLGFYQLFMMGYFLGLTLYAMYGIAWIEKATDKHFGVPNGVTAYNQNQTLFFLLLVMGIVFVFTPSTEIFKQLIVSYLFLLVVLKSIFTLFKKQLKKRNWYRIAIEWSFLIPWICI